VEFVKIYDTNNVKLILNGICLYTKPTTVLILFELEPYTYGISKKFEYFVSFLRQNCITNKSDAANTLYIIYDKNSIIECELIIYVNGLWFRLLCTYYIT